MLDRRISLQLSATFPYMHQIGKIKQQQQQQQQLQQQQLQNLSVG